MPSDEAKVEWCLKKAQNEIKAGGRHRGLIKAKPNINLALAPISKAEHNLLTISKFKEAGFSDWSASAAFYCAYHCFLAILAKSGYESRNQECTFALISLMARQKKISIDEGLLSEIISIKPEEKAELPSIVQLRELEQYGASTSIDDGSYERLLTISKSILDSAKEIIEVKP